MHAVQQEAPVRSLLELDPELGAGIPAEDWERAIRACQVEFSSIPPGPWDLSPGAAQPKALAGHLIVSGLVCRELALRESHMLELLGRGDIVQPPPEREWPGFVGATNVTAIEPTFAASLGDRFAEAAGRWPTLLVSVVQRLEHQRERLAIQGLIAHVAQAEHRLLLQLWHLGALWGRVTPNGIAVPFHLTHDLLGYLIGARRSTVTLAARRLIDEGYVRRADDGTWLLLHDAERYVSSLAAPASRRSVGELLMTRQRSLQVRAESEALRAQARHLRSTHESAGN